jgi:hypothetical protein
LRSAYRGGARGAICSAALQAEFSLGNDDQGAARHRPSRRHGMRARPSRTAQRQPTVRIRPPDRVSTELRERLTAALLAERFESLKGELCFC